MHAFIDEEDVHFFKLQNETKEFANYNLNDIASKCEFKTARQLQRDIEKIEPS